MVPDQRGVVGDRRSPSRPLMPFGNSAPRSTGRRAATGAARAGRSNRSPRPAPRRCPRLPHCHTCHACDARAGAADEADLETVRDARTDAAADARPQLATPVAQSELTTPPPTPEPVLAETTPAPTPEPEPPPMQLTTPVAPPAAAAWPTPDQVLMATPATEPLPMLAPQLESERRRYSSRTRRPRPRASSPRVKRQPTPAGLTDLALGPTVQVKVDPDGVPLTLPALRPNTPAPERAPAPVARQQDADPRARDARRGIRRGRGGLLRARSRPVQARSGRYLRRSRSFRRRRRQ